MNAWIFIIVGVVLWGGCFAVSRSLGGGSWPSLVRATRTFVIAWFMVSVMNMWIGVTQVGHTASDELPVSLQIFGIPVTVAVVSALFVARRRREP